MEDRVTNAEVIGVLNNLIKTCKDGENGFRTAAEGTQNKELTTLFNLFAQQRAQFAAELQTEVRGLGDAPQTEGSVMGSLHRGWINIKNAVAGNDESAVISECERGEDAAVQNYKEALAMNLPKDVFEIVQNQYVEVQKAHDRIRSLEIRVDNNASANVKM